MNDSDLKQHLGALTPPAPPPATRDGALAAALNRLPRPTGHSRARNTASPFVSRRASWFQRWMPALLGSAAAIAAVLPILLGVFGLSRQNAGDASVAATIVADADRETLAQVVGLFPGQFNAVIERDGAFQIDLIPASASASASPRASDSPASVTQPLVVELVRPDDRQRLRILSYSGRTIRVELDGNTLVFDALLTGEGDIILAGNNFLWSSTHPVRLAGYEINATSLHSSAPTSAISVL